MALSVHTPGRLRANTHCSRVYFPQQRLSSDSTSLLHSAPTTSGYSELSEASMAMSSTSKLLLQVDNLSGVEVCYNVHTHHPLPSTPISLTPLPFTSWTPPISPTSWTLPIFLLLLGPHTSPSLSLMGPTPLPYEPRSSSFLFLMSPTPLPLSLMGPTPLPHEPRLFPFPLVGRDHPTGQDPSSR